MSLLREIKAICKKYNIKPVRRRGQNFLINEQIIEKLILAAELKKNDIVLEIGAGIGTLTKEIAKKAKKVIAIEIDKRLVNILKQELADYKNVEIIQGDVKDNCLIIKLLNCCLSFKIVSNLPYNITGIVLRKFLETRSPKLKSMVLVLQKEVGQRIIACPPKMSKLSVMVQFYGKAKIIHQIKRHNFYPKPNVDSVIIKIIPNRGSTSIGGQTSSENFFKIVKAGFSSPRKYLLNNLAKNAIINKKEKVENIFQKIGLNKKVRAQELSIEEWIKLTTEFRSVAKFK